MSTAKTGMGQRKRSADAHYRAKKGLLSSRVDGEGWLSLPQKVPLGKREWARLGKNFLTTGKVPKGNVFSTQW